VDTDIRTGTLSPQLLKPLHPMHLWLTGVVSSKPIQTAIVLPPIAIASALLGIRYDLNLTTLVLALLAAGGALLIEFFVQAIIGSLAFWISHGTAIADVWFWVRSLLSGWIIPLAMFPLGLQIALIYLPFRYCLAFPIEIILGQLTPDQIVLGFVMQYAWVAVFWAVFQIVWRRGVRSYSAVGA
jgi:ABC-2 type transport system permease protein